MTDPDPLVGDGDGQTPLTDQEAAGLRLSYITTCGELNIAEQDNIAKAMTRSTPTLTALFDDKYLRDLHLAMFGEVWDWAGKYRSTMRNIGIPAAQISVTVRDLCDDAAAWVAAGEDLDRVAARFSHRLVAIHPFPNGNGRHSRRAADLVLIAGGRDPFAWGAASGAPADELRRRYLAALRQADGDGEDIDDLITFGRS
jgi:Fic-DOC domain mobile mystery protein B